MDERPRFPIRVGILVVIVAATLLGLSIVGDLWLSCGTDHGAREDVRKAYQAQQPVRLTFRVIDQFGNPASNYRFKVTLESVNWFYRWVPSFAMTNTECIVMTDGQGVGHLDWRVKKALRMRLSENVVDYKMLEGYIFPVGRAPSSRSSFEDDPLASFPVPPLVGGRQEIVMKVLKRTIPKTTLAFKPPLLKGYNLIRLPTRDELQITVSLKHNTLDLERTDGDILITVRNAKAAGQAYWDHRYHSNLPWNNPPQWEVRLEGLSGTVMLPVGGNSHVCDPPLSGYYNSVIYRSCSDETKAPHYPRVNPKPDEWASGTPVYYFFGSGPWECFFVRTDNPRYYCWFEMRLDVNAEGQLSIAPSGFCNLDGKPTL